MDNADNTKTKFNKKEYDMLYKRNNYKKLSVDMKIKDYEELNKLLEEKNLTKAQFLRNAIEDLKK